MDTHKLKIHSLHDAQATCSCGLWEFVRTGSMSRKELTDIWQMHVNYMDAVDLNRAVAQWYSYSLTEQERNALVRSHRGAIEYNLTVVYDRLPKSAKDAVSEAYKAVSHG